MKQERSGTGGDFGTQLDAGSPSRLCASETTAKTLPRTEMGDYIERYAKERLQELGAGDAASQITIRVVGNYDRSVTVLPLVKKHFTGAGRHDTYPDELGYQVKNIFLFQKIDGMDVCLFAM